MRAVATGVLAAVALLLAGCQGPQSALDPGGPGAAAIAQSWWVMFWGSVAIFALTIGLAGAAFLRRGDRPMRTDPMKIVIGLGLVFPSVTLVALLAYGVGLGQSLLPSATDDDPLIVEVQAHQWWWEFRYPAGPGGDAVHTANELHIPVGRPVHLRIGSTDVIHSFWVPPLGHKIDATPGLTTTLRILADREGTFRGQCAEFCGAQHARMRIVVHAHSPEEFERMLAAIAGAGAMRDGQAMQGAMAGAPQAFDAHCAQCHSIDPLRREPAIGPNLGALPLRGTLGAGTLPNDPNNLRRWLWDHQSIKPGNRMAIVAHLEPEVLEGIARLLEAGR
jgi:cytochrome c oxidase subunit II